MTTLWRCQFCVFIRLCGFRWPIKRLFGCCNNFWHREIIVYLFFCNCHSQTVTLLWLSKKIVCTRSAIYANCLLIIRIYGICFWAYCTSNHVKWVILTQWPQWSSLMPCERLEFYIIVFGCVQKSKWIQLPSSRNNEK